MKYCNHSIEDFVSLFQTVDSELLLNFLSKKSDVQLGSNMEDAALQVLWDRNPLQLFTREDFIHVLSGELLDDQSIRGMISQKPMDSISYRFTRLLLAIWQDSTSPHSVKAITRPKETKPREPKPRETKPREPKPRERYLEL